MNKIKDGDFVKYVKWYTPDHPKASHHIYEGIDLGDIIEVEYVEGGRIKFKDGNSHIFKPECFEKVNKEFEAHKERLFNAN